MIYEPTSAFRARFSGKLFDTELEAFEDDIEFACEMISHKHNVRHEIRIMEARSDYFTNVHRAILFLADIINKRKSKLMCELGLD